MVILVGECEGDRKQTDLPLIELKIIPVYLSSQLGRVKNKRRIMGMYQFTWFRAETNTWCQREKYYKLRCRKIQNQRKNRPEGPPE